MQAFTLRIFFQNNLVETKEIEDSFYIVMDNEKLFWETGKEQRTTRRGGVIHVWLKLSGTISFVRPDWKLKVDDVECPKGFYIDVEIIWRKVELQFNDYLFEFVFEQNDFSLKSLPLPVKLY